jgi:predicted TIM-barrel fold metal-dependent hydrolase
VSARVDVNAFIGPYPFRAVPHPDPDALVRVMDREEIAEAWVASLPAVWHRDPEPANEELLQRLKPYAPRLRPVAAVRPDWPRWRETLQAHARAGVVAVRAYPSHWGLAPGHPLLTELAAACAQRSLPLILTVRFEDLRKRHDLDQAPDLAAATVRELARAGTNATLIVTAAGREFIEEVHWGLTPNEQSRLFWDISWVWGPPEDHLAHLFGTLGASRFVFGTGWPLRLAQTPRASLALLPDEMRDASLADPRAW